MVPRTFTETGSVVEANTLFTACTSIRIELSASTMAVPEALLVTPKYLPLPLAATLFMSAVMSGPAPVVPGSTSMT
ncbi:hypothetical protein D3C83_14150 [compost metagenome]